MAGGGRGVYQMSTFAPPSLMSEFYFYLKSSAMYKHIVNKGVVFSPISFESQIKRIIFGDLLNL